MTTVLLVGGDLMAKSRLAGAASRARVTLDTTTVDRFAERLRESQPSLVVIDLDEGREPALKEVQAVRDQGLSVPRTVGYYSHVDRALGEAAERAGCEAWPRGKFWNGLDRLLPTGS